MDAQPHLARVRLSPWALSDRVIDAGLIALLSLGFFIERGLSDSGADWLQWAAFATAVTLVLIRRRHPIGFLATALILALVSTASLEAPSALFPVSLLLVYTVASRSSRSVAVAAGVATTGTFVVLVAVLLRRDAIEEASLAAIAWPAFATALGIAVRSTRLNVAAAHERATRAEATRELEAQQRVIEERLRIARDVHDIVAHHIAVVNVQAGVAEHLIESDPTTAAESIGAARRAASTVLEELGELLGVLRAPEDSSDPTTPTPDLASIDDLVGAFAASGLTINTERSGTPRPLTRSVELAAYRVVQEALTNASKHGGGTASLSLRHTDDGLTISVTNPAASAAGGAGNGFGLVGMTERVHAAGGTLQMGTSHDNQCFELVATLPRVAI